MLLCPPGREGGQREDPGVLSASLSHSIHCVKALIWYTQFKEPQWGFSSSDFNSFSFQSWGNKLHKGIQAKVFDALP